DVIGPYVDDEYGDVFGTIYTLTGDGFDYAELKVVADEVRDELLLLDQVAKVEIDGAQTETIFIDYNNAHLRELGLSPQQLGNTLASVNILSSGGDVLIGRDRITLEPSGNFESLEDIRRVIVSIPGSSEGIYLEDIAMIYRGYESPPDNMVHATGKPALTISLSMKEGGNILQLGESLNAIMPAIKARYPHGIELSPIMFQPQVVADSVNGFMCNLLQAICIVFVVILVFLGIRTGIVVATLIPSAMAITFVAMQVFDVGINKISLAALIIALGLLVDNGIVMSEGILVRLEKGEQKIKAAIATGKELLIPLLTSSLTTTAAFLPIALAKSGVGEFTADLAKVVAMTLIISWLLAMTFIPLLAAALIKVKKQKSDSGATFSGRWYGGYRVLLNFALKFKIIFFAIIIALFMLSIKGLDYVPKAFIPASETPVVNAKFNMPVGTAIEATEAVALDIEQFLATKWGVTKEAAAAGKEGVLDWMTFVGTGAPRFVLGYNAGAPSSRHFALIANITSAGLVPELSRSVNAYAHETYPDLEIQFKKLENGPPVSYPIQIRLMGKDKEILYNLSADVKQHLYSLPFVTAVNDDWGLQVKKILIKIDQERARLARVTSEDVAQSLEASLSGTDLTQFREDDKLIPITLRSVASDRKDLDKLEGITVYSSSSSAQVPLKQVADVEVVWQPGLIKRRDRLRSMTVNVQLKEGITATEANAVLLPWLDEQAWQWPQGYRYEQGGEFEASGDAAKSIIDELPLAA
ncbi:MAG: efflux RND transporter permease subunit, partial [bacterium]|nr:efflux RND transporter permease subunit [bacterium]